VRTCSSDVRQVRDLLQHGGGGAFHTGVCAGAQQRHRAIGGLSMGAFQSVEIGLAHPDRFGYVLAYSGGFGALGPQPPASPEAQPPWKELLAQPSAKHLPLLFLGCGQQETGMLAPGKRLVQLLADRGARAKWADYPGGHVFSVWRNLLHESVPLLFKGARR